MKIEICESTRDAIVATSICATVCAVAFLLYRYNALAYENGYTQRQLEYSQQTVWVKP